MGDLDGRTALVTGVSRRVGIGFAIARRLLEDGATVFVHSWTPHDAAQEWGTDPGGIEAVLDELRQYGRVEHREGDFADPDEPARTVAAARSALGTLDILVANHARSGRGRLSDVTADELDAFLHENVRATVLLVREFAAQHEAGTPGRIVLLTSGQHLAPMAGELSYAVSKGAVQQATMTLAEELADAGITVNTVNPGPTDTGWGLAEIEPAPMPFGRWGEPEDAARLIAWLCADDARWITGQVLNSEGGFRRWR